MKLERFLGSSSSEAIPGCPVLLGCPLDATSTFRRGSAEAPDAIREASDSIETYSPLLDRDLIESPFCDRGDVPLVESFQSCLEQIGSAVTDALERKGRPMCIGGEHTISLPAVKAVADRYNDLVVLHLDAHSDLRDEYEGSRVNHATVIRRIVDFLGSDRLIQMGVRAGTRQEFLWMRDNRTLLEWTPGSERILRRRIAGRPLYVTLDLDVLDPSCLPGTGNPEAGGWSYGELERLLRHLLSEKVVAADVVELNPGLDASGVSAVTAAKIVRELLMILAANPQSG